MINDKACPACNAPPAQMDAKKVQPRDFYRNLPGHPAISFSIRWGIVEVTAIVTVPNLPKALLPVRKQLEHLWC